MSVIKAAGVRRERQPGGIGLQIHRRENQPLNRLANLPRQIIMPVDERRPGEYPLELRALIGRVCAPTRRSGIPSSTRTASMGSAIFNARNRLRQTSPTHLQHRLRDPFVDLGRMFEVHRIADQTPASARPRDAFAHGVRHRPRRQPPCCVGISLVCRRKSLFPVLGSRRC